MLNKNHLFKLGVILLSIVILLFSVSFESFKSRYIKNPKLSSRWLVTTYFDRLKDQLHPFKTPRFYSTLAIKRLNEANFLWQQKHFNLAKQQLIKAINYHCLSQNPSPFPLPPWVKKLSPADPYYWWIKHSTSCPKKTNNQSNPAILFN